jgi:hypothetical protein
MRHIKHFKRGERSYSHHPGIGVFQVPQHIQDELNTASKQSLFERCDVDGFIDPFVFGEIMNRGLYAEYERWAHPPQPQQSILDIMMAGESEA